MFKRTMICAIFLTLGWAGPTAAQPAPRSSDVPMPPLIEPVEPNDTAFAFLELPPKPGAMAAGGPVAAPDNHQVLVAAPGLMTTIVDWLSAELGLPATHEHPRTELISPQAMVAKRYRGLVSGQNQALNSDLGRDLVALYEDATRTIYLLEGWTGTTPLDESVLVHEMVHHLQNVAGLRYECAQAREKPAYAAQQKWLARSGHDFFHEFETDPMTILLRTLCLYL
jgi:hypothetical protein